MKKLGILLSVLVFTLSLSLTATAFASEGNEMKGSPMVEGKAGVAINGYCPVCITKGKYVRGDSKFSTLYKGKVYHFPGFNQQKMFINDPEAYLDGLEAKYRALKANPQGTKKKSGTYKGSY